MNTKPSGKMNNFSNNQFFLFKVLLYVICLTSMPSIFGETGEHSEKKILICGICQNIEAFVDNAIQNATALGHHFSDYKVIIYENNSTDGTSAKLAEWAHVDSHVIFVSETLRQEQLPIYRTERIARARNVVLDIARELPHQDFEYLMMVDLDFNTDWSIQEILKTVDSPLEWDCVSANGCKWGTIYWDRYAFRDELYPFGPEMLGSRWWELLGGKNATWFVVSGDEWIPAYSGFGGLAIYKTSSILPFSYSGSATEDLSNYYKQILVSLPEDNIHLQEYLAMIGKESETELSQVPIFFQKNTEYLAEPLADYAPVCCCEHVPLHASMSLNDFGKFYINPKILMHY